MNILFEDNHLIVVHKESGLLVQPTNLESDCLLNRLKSFIKVRDNKPGNVFLEPIHRIDKPVSGIVVFAKTSKALSRMMKSIREKECTKIYIALVTGKLPAREGKLEHSLVHDEYHARICPKEGKPSVLYYKLIKKREETSLLEITLETGRYHQIRAQLSAIGCPIVGDKKYGSQKTYQKNAIALCHAKFSIPHPTTREILHFEVSNLYLE